MQFIINMKLKRNMSFQSHIVPAVRLVIQHPCPIEISDQIPIDNCLHVRPSAHDPKRVPPVPLISMFPLLAAFHLPPFNFP